MPMKNGHLYEFGPFLLDTAQHLLSRDGQPVALTPKTYDALLLLVESKGRMLFKDELMGSLWPKSFVEESNLTQQVSMIRKALGETSGENRYIVTVPGRGYRFAAPVVDRAQQMEPEPSAAVSKRPRWLAAGLIVAVAAIGFSIYWMRSASRHAKTVRSLAILPFRSLREDPRSEFLGFSLADAVITKLAYVSSLTVRPSSAVEKYRGGSTDLHQIAQDLHVDTLLTGNFLRDGNDLRITSQLVDVRTDNIIWNGTYDLKYDRLLTVQDRVAQQIVKGLELSLPPGEAERLKSSPVDPRAYEFFLHGVDLYARNDSPMAIKMLQTSAEIDPNYALTWAHLGRAHTANASFELGGRDEYGAAQDAYKRALALDSSQIEAQIYMANRFTDTGHVESAVPLLRNVLKTNANLAEAHWELGYAYRFAGMLHESARECERALELDPGVKLGTSTLTTYLYLGQYEKFLQSLPSDNDAPFTVFYRGFGEYYRKRAVQAAQHFDRAFEMRSSLLHAQIGKAFSDTISNRKQAALDALRRIEKAISDRGVGDPEAIYKVAQGYAVAGDKTSAIRVLRLSIENGFFSYPYIIADPLLENLHSEQEFTSVTEIARARFDAFRRTFFPQP